MIEPTNTDPKPSAILRTSGPSGIVLGCLILFLISKMESSSISAFILVIILIIFMVSLILMIRDTGPTNVFFRCEAGECATSLVSGAKRCPATDTDRVIYSPQYEVCNRRDLCNSSLTPFAERGDGSTAVLGGCEGGLPCRCLKELRCGNHFISSFIVKQGSVFLGTERPVLSIAPDTPPIIINDITTQFCTVVGPLLPNVSGANGCKAAATTPSLTSFSQCIKSNPCPNGVMAFVPSNPETFVLQTGNLDAWTTTPMGCVAGEVLTNLTTSNPSLIGTSALCQNNDEVPLYDVYRGELRCYQVS